MRKVLDPVFVLFIIMMEAHIIVIPALSWVYGMVKRKNQGISPTSGRIDNSDFILKSNAALIGKVKVHLYAYGLLSLLLGKAIGSSVLFSVGNWLLVLGITAGAVAFCKYLFRWLREPYSI
jgi:hypothetical protein